MDKIMKAPVAERCGSLGRVAGEAFSCLLHVGHAGVHAAEPGPGETVTWPKEGDTAPMSGFIGPYGLKPDTTEEQQRQTSDYERREARRDAVELAVRALEPRAGLYDTTGTYLRKLIEVATRIGNYIQEGK